VALFFLNCVFNHKKIKIMKKNLLLIAAIFLMATRSLATTYMVDVANYSFTPSTLTVHPGDVIMWMWVSGAHTTTSTTIPTGATPWNSNISSATLSFAYTVPSILGVYNYYCTIHPTLMIASFTVVSATEVPVVNPTPLFSMYPNPVSGQVHLRFDKSGIPIFVTLNDMAGEEVLRKEYMAIDETDISLQGIPNGSYVISAEQGTNFYKQTLVVTH
jgi:plastocyanin